MFPFFDFSTVSGLNFGSFCCDTKTTKFELFLSKYLNSLNIGVARAQIFKAQSSRPAELWLGPGPSRIFEMSPGPTIRMKSCAKPGRAVPTIWAREPPLIEHVKWIQILTKNKCIGKNDKFPSESTLKTLIRNFPT